MPLPLTVSCFSKIQIGFTFLVPAHPGSPGKRDVCVVPVHCSLPRSVSMSVCLCASLFAFQFMRILPELVVQFSANFYATYRCLNWPTRGSTRPGAESDIYLRLFCVRERMSMPSQGLVRQPWKRQLLMDTPRLWTFSIDICYPPSHILVCRFSVSCFGWIVWHCWLGIRKSIWLVKTEWLIVGVVIWLELMPLFCSVL